VRSLACRQLDDTTDIVITGLVPVIHAFFPF